MIETSITGMDPAVIHHRVSGTVSDQEVLVGVKEALVLVRDVVTLSGKFDLILDMRGYVVNIQTHRRWSLEFKEHELIVGNTDRVAVVGDDSPTLDAEKALLASEKLNFFTSLAEAERWIARKVD
ncbi:MAG: hypothetical protein OEZ39_16035 [Gammaproteobacteria bacterium]|nr:hypothetical protein [Gammaproteobacteria bacterium]MDH5653368.1 hypothetical protein [Gammaproteobacteria bacterium]